MVGIKQFTLYPVGDDKEVSRVYKYLRDGQETEAQMKNLYISALYAATLQGATKEEKEELTKPYRRTPNSKLNSAYVGRIDPDKYPTGLPIASGVLRGVKPVFDAACKKGLLHGACSLPSFRKDGPLDIPKMYVMPRGTYIQKSKTGEHPADVGLYYDKERYPTPMDFNEALLHGRSFEMYMKFANDITFIVNFGNLKKSRGLRKAIEGIYSGEVKCCDSKIQVVGKRIFLKMTLDFPEEKHGLDPGTVVGVDIGYKVPIMCALNDNEYVRLAVGEGGYLTRKRIAFQKERRRMSKSVRNSSMTGHGRGNLMKPAWDLRDKESRFNEHYNHVLSKRAVEFAVKNHAGVIQMENLSGITRKERGNFLLKNWTYYDLQQKIEYKAKQVGIEVRYVEPAYTSQVCSLCGYKGVRVKQAEFQCVNPKCRIHGKYKEAKGKGYDMNADFNGARNIALSDHFTLDTTEVVKIIPGTIEDECLEGLLTEGATYSYCYVCGDTTSIMCDDGRWHDFDLSKLKTAFESKDKTAKGKKRKGAKKTA